MQVCEYRYNMYSCFMQIPQGTVRSLALKPILLDEEDDDEEDDVINTEAAQDMAYNERDEGDTSTTGRQLGGPGADSTATSLFTATMDEDNLGGKSVASGRSLSLWSSLGGESAAASKKVTSELGNDGGNGRPEGTLWSKLTTIMTFGRLRAQVAPTPGGNAKHLVRSNDAAIWLVSVGGMCLVGITCLQAYSYMVLYFHENKSSILWTALVLLLWSCLSYEQPMSLTLSFY